MDFKYSGYHFFIDDLELPYAPSELNVTIGSNNSTVELINGTEINILKYPKLTEIEFDVELPRGRQYAFANKLQSPIKFLDYFESLMRKKKPCKLIVVRTPPGGGKGTTDNGFASNSWNVTLEGYDLKEDAENAYDIIVSLKFKEYVEYGTIKKKVVTTSTKNKTTTTKKTSTKAKKSVPKDKTYTVKSGDCLWNIAKKFYGNGSKHTVIYKANKKVIENTAKKYGRKSSYYGSTPGWWIYPGTKLTIPMS